MRRGRKWARRIGRIGGTVAIGAMLGFVVPTIIAEYSPKPEIQAQVDESPLAREFITAYIDDDQNALEKLGVSADMRLRASRLTTDFAKIDPPVHLGSFVSSGIALHAYTTHVVMADGSQDLVGWRVVTAGGQVGLILPPSPIEPNP
jgi:hypothetical protein